jgi:hypothetical protein
MEVRGDRELYGPPKEGESLLEDRAPYQSAIGELMWLANRTRPDISFATNILARYTKSPTKRHWKGVLRILKYLRGTIDLGLLFRRKGETTIKGYADAGYKSDPITGKSQGGYVYTMAGAAISWRSKKQTTVATSTAHAELIALYEGCRTGVWLKRLSNFVEIETGLPRDDSPIKVHEDNEACLSQVSGNFVRTDAIKHIDPKYHTWVSQENGTSINVVSIPSKDNTADIFTKALPREAHWRHVEGLGLTKSNADAS